MMKPVTDKNSTRIVVGLSGGIDSAVTALLLKQQGYHVIGATLLLAPADPTTDPTTPRCGSDESAAAAAVANQLNIPHHKIDLRPEFEEQVLAPCWHTLSTGATPNPCVLCNSVVRFKALRSFATTQGADLVATGHYARLMPGTSGKPQLHRGTDPTKDQSYFLYAVNPELLQYVRFPLGSMTKSQVRTIAQQAGLINAERAESQDLCFAGAEGEFAEMLRQRFAGTPTPGVIIDENGEQLTRHSGIHRFTIGQRRGLGVATGSRVRVTSINPLTGTVKVSANPNDACATKCSANNFVWHTTPLPPDTPITAQVRYRQPPSPGKITVWSPANQQLSITFDNPVYSITPGQSLVLYHNNLVLGGGTLIRTPEPRSP